MVWDVPQGDARGDWNVAHVYRAVTKCQKPLFVFESSTTLKKVRTTLNNILFEAPTHFLESSTTLRNISLSRFIFFTVVGTFFLSRRGLSKHISLESKYVFRRGSVERAFIFWPDVVPQKYPMDKPSHAAQVADDAQREACARKGVEDYVVDLCIRGALVADGRHQRFIDRRRR